MKTKKLSSEPITANSINTVLVPVCDCLLGYLDDKPLFNNDFLSRLKDLSDMMPTFKHYGLMTGKCLSPKEIADGRKGYLQRYNFCPKCGIKINWKALLNRC
jgi:hypothetical protein